MSYELTAVIGGFDLLRSLTDGIREASVAPLRQRMGLVPATERSGFLITDQILGHWAQNGPIALVEAEFFGGDGHQSAEVWRDGGKVWGPARSRDFSGPWADWPINAALALIGVGLRNSEDLFLEVGLGWERDTDGWCAAGEGARWAATYEEWHREHERAERAAVEAERTRALRDVLVALDGKGVMEVLGLPPGPLIGAAMRHLRELHLELGPLTREESVERLRAWAVEQGARER